jgi:diguanylate cyclase (GGDEF)-like protein
MMKFRNLTRRFIYLVLPIVITPLLIVVIIISNRMTDDLTRQNELLFSALLDQVNTRINHFYKKSSLDSDQSTALDQDSLIEYVSQVIQEAVLLRQGTLYVTTDSGNLLAANHPAGNEFFTWNSRVSRYEKRNKLVEIDTVNRMTLADYNSLNSDPGIINDNMVRKLLADGGPGRDIPGIIARDTVKYNRKSYLLVAHRSDDTGITLLFFLPSRYIIKPVLKLIRIVVIITLFITLTLLPVIILVGRHFTRPIVKDRLQLEKINRKLQNLDRMKNDFIANITHDFRSPLTVILGLTDLAIKSEQDHSRKSINTFKLIHTSSLKLNTVIDRLLDLEKLDSQSLVVRVRPIMLSSFIRDMTTFFATALSESGISISSIVPEYEFDNFYSDQIKLEEVLNILIQQAIHSVDASMGIIQICLEKSGDAVIITVKDNGYGLDKDDTRILFDRFQTAGRDASIQYDNMGINLAYANQLVELIKGRIWVESEGPGKGTTFHIELLLGSDVFNEEDIVLEEISENYRREMQEMLQGTVLEKIEEHSTETFIHELNRENEFDVNKGVIMIIDDDKYVREIVKDYLERAGYTNFITAADGSDGLEAIYRYNPDCIICDFKLPSMSGEEIYEQITRDTKYKLTPFILLSAMATKKVVMEMKLKGASAYLKKPIDENELTSTVTQQIKNFMQYRKTIHMATIDELTMVNNKRTVLNHLKQFLALRKYQNLSIIFLDIDFFKSINDKFGHPGGDILLTEVATLVNNMTFDTHIMGRFGGEEFIILLPDSDSGHTLHVAESLRQTMEKHTFRLGTEVTTITASFGMVSLHENESWLEQKLNIPSLKEIFEIPDPDNANWSEIRRQKKELTDLLLTMVDKALYRAKSSTCSKCGFRSVNQDDFQGKLCPKCNHTEIDWGRNRVSLFKADMMD